MLSKKDKTEIRTLIGEEFSKALTRTIEVERCPRKQGDPVKAVKDEAWNIIDFITGYFPYIEGALRGVQDDAHDAKINSAKALVASKAMAGILETTHKAIVAITSFASGLEQLPNLETEVLRIVENAMATKALPHLGLHGPSEIDSHKDYIHNQITDAEWDEEPPPSDEGIDESNS